MPIDKTDRSALSQLKEIYKDEIIKYEYKYWKKSYLAPPPPKSYAQSMLRYRKYYKVEYIVLKDGSKIKVDGCGHGTNNTDGCLFGSIIFILIFIGLLIFI